MNTYQRQRAERIKQATEGVFDICIIGGGVHGAWMARDAAIRGFKTLLLEANDYAFATSSRSSKMLHGGVRYLERGDIKLVFEALRERERCLRIAPHLCRKQKFIYPIISGETRPGWQVRIGLGAYDLLAKLGQGRNSFPGHRVIKEEEKVCSELKGFGLNFKSLLEYSDGQMNDARIVVEAIIQASSLGATCLNYAKVLAAKKNNNWQLNFLAEGEEHLCEAKVVINTTGPWVGQLAKDFVGEIVGFPRVVWSRGIHLLFPVAWNRAGLILPTGEKGRYYFIWPHFLAGSCSTLVGTTDQKTEELDEDPTANQAEIEQLLGYIKRDLPNSDLAKSSPYQTFCGVRTLAAKAKSADKMSSSLSRSEIWIETDGMIHQVGGKFTNARATAEKAINKASVLLGKEKPDASQLEQLRNHPLPGSEDFDFEAQLTTCIRELGEVFTGATEQNLRERAESLVGRFGSKAAKILQLVDKKEENISNNKYLQAEIKYTLLFEQAITIEDVLFRRLCLAHLPLEHEACREDIARTIGQLNC